ncbi:hypothetical protein BH23GEM5_BH23GEM5_24350 [soil metagenome]
MIDLTPLDVQKKKGDFRRSVRGYDPSAVDEFLDLVLERMTELVRENSSLSVSMDNLAQGLAGFRERERALNEALVSAQQLREDMRSQANREADLVLREARSEAERIVADAKRQVGTAAEALRRIQAPRVRFLGMLRKVAERQIAEIELEEDRLRDPGKMEMDSLLERNAAPDSGLPQWLPAAGHPREDS